jgi:hypothetical protein
MGEAMLDSADWAQMAADLAEVRGDNSVSIVIRRGATTLAAQTVRIANAGGGSQASGTMTEESRGRVIVAGATTFNVQPEDRFNDGAGRFYRVVLVRPNVRASVVAEAELVE